jgi:hypothetical protein
MFNNLGIYSSNFPVGSTRFGGIQRGSSIRTVQFGGGRRNGGIITVGTGAGPAPTPTPLVETVTDTTPQITTLASGTVPVTGMSLTWPIASDALATFTTDYSIVGAPTNITLAASIDAGLMSAQLAALPGGVVHGAVLGNGETLVPGVYDIVGPADIQGILTLSGVGNPDALFVFRIVGTLTSDAASQIQLINGATANNVFWRTTGNVVLGANSIFRGTALAVPGLINVGAGSVVNGRLLSTLGAINTDSDVINQPGATTTAIILGALASFALFTSSGAVTNTGTSVINGDIGTNLGLITGFGLPSVVNGNIYAAGTLIGGPVSVSFRFYVNGVAVGVAVPITNTTDIAGTLTNSQTFTLAIGDIVTVRSTVTLGTMTVTNKTLTLTQVL